MVVPSRLPTVYPVFHDADAYVAKRSNARLRDAARFALERIALDRLTRDLPADLRVLDVPCGPGRLAPYWMQRGWEVLGIDYAPEMIERARRDHGRDPRCSFRRGDAFALDVPDASVDLVACIRFVYYFDPTDRLRLLRRLRRVTRCHVLLQVQEDGTFAHALRRRRRDLRAGRRRTKTKEGTTREEITAELEVAGFAVERIVRVHPLTDRTFVLARIADSR